MSSLLIKKFMTKYIIFFICSFSVSFLYAGGMQLYELTNPSLGAADVGQTAGAQDPSVAYFNPAGLK